MGDRWPDLAGRVDNDVHALGVRVYYEDTDFSGAVYHANYLKFCERGRSDCLRLLGIHHHELLGKGADERLMFVVRRLDCEFFKPARIDDVLEVETRFAECAGARLELEQRITRKGEILFGASVTVALIDGRGKPKRLPSDLVRTLQGRAARR